MVDDIKVGLLEKFMPPLYLEAAGKKKPPVDLGSAAKLCTGVDPVPPLRLGEAPLLCTGVDLVPAARLGAAPKLRPGVDLGQQRGLGRRTFAFQADPPPTAAAPVLHRSSPAPLSSRPSCPAPPPSLQARALEPAPAQQWLSARAPR